MGHYFVRFKYFLIYLILAIYRKPLVVQLNIYSSKIFSLRFIRQSLMRPSDYLKFFCCSPRPPSLSVPYIQHVQGEENNIWNNILDTIAHTEVETFCSYLFPCIKYDLFLINIVYIFSKLYFNIYWSKKFREVIQLINQEKK